MQVVPQERIKILLLAEYGLLNGGERSCLAVLSRLIGREIEVCAALPCPSPFAQRLEQIGCKVFPLAIHNDDGQKLDQAYIRDQIAGLVTNTNPHIVHANSLSMARTLGPINVTENAKKLGHIRDIIKLSRKAIEDVNQLDLIVAVSNATSNFHVDQGIDPSKIVTVYNGIDPRQFVPNTDFMEEFSFAPGTKLFIAIGQISLRKGFDTLLLAFLNHANAVPDTQLLIAGARNSHKQESIDFEKNLHHLVETSNHQSRVRFLGTRSDIPGILPQCFALVHCARQEPLGRVLLESCAAGLPVIATKVGGTPEIFKHDQEHGAILVEPDDIEQIATAMTELAKNPQLVMRYGELNRNIALDRFNLHDAANNILAIYRQMISQ